MVDAREFKVKANHHIIISISERIQLRQVVKILQELAKVLWKEIAA